uniref:Uncharacterized protein n=1 Tax=Eutreptiella gymnastica TaxID=73025 RepID=A0A7S1NEI6_9EUGL
MDLGTQERQCLKVQRSQGLQVVSNFPGAIMQDVLRDDYLLAIFLQVQLCGITAELSYPCQGTVFCRHAQQLWICLVPGLYCLTSHPHPPCGPLSFTARASIAFFRPTAVKAPCP